MTSEYVSMFDVLPGRRQLFQRNPDLEMLITEINSLLQPGEQAIAQSFNVPRYPTLLIVGVPRSGTTLVLQWLASLDAFAYPTNFLSRFYLAPYVGAKLQLMLADPRYRFRDEFSELQDCKFDFNSSLGKTKGLLAPNEFWYFWRRFLPYGDIHYLDEAALMGIDKETLTRELAALESVFDKPLAMKAMIANCNLDFLGRVLDKAIFLHVVREPRFNIQSLLEARIAHTGSEQCWYSFKPPEYESLLHLDAYEQVAGQVYFLNRRIRDGLMSLPACRVLTVEYEKLCRHPASVYAELHQCMDGCGYVLPQDYRGPASFMPGNEVRLDDEKMRRVQRAYARYD
jgi:hypothetical protein